jgi:hypothetical protein
MSRSRLFGLSLNTLLSLIIVTTITGVMSVQASYDYYKTKAQTLEAMEIDSLESIVAVQKSVSSFMASYAVNEYVKLVGTEMERRNIFAIIIEDYNMGKILGQPAYITGKIRNEQYNVIDFDPKNGQQRQALKACFFSQRHMILDQEKQELGAVTVYIWAKSWMNVLP